MGDVGEYWREHREYLKKKRSTQREADGLGGRDVPDLTPRFSKLGFERKSIWHWQARIDGKVLDYWPTANKWRFDGRNHVGLPSDLIGFIKKRTPNPDPKETKK